MSAEAVSRIVQTIAVFGRMASCLLKPDDARPDRNCRPLVAHSYRGRPLHAHEDRIGAGNSTIMPTDRSLAAQEFLHRPSYLQKTVVTHMISHQH